MRIATFSLVLFLTAFLVHWVIWRVRVPRRQTAALLAILLGTLPAGLTIAVLTGGLYAWAPASGWELLQVVTFHVALALAYVVTYSLLEEHSPSLTLVKFVHAAGDRGRARAELLALLDGNRSLEGRVEALLRDGMVTQTGGTLRLTTKGLWWARTFGLWRRLYRMELGG